MYLCCQCCLQGLLWHIQVNDAANTISNQNSLTSWREKYTKLYFHVPRILIKCFMKSFKISTFSLLTLQLQNEVIFGGPLATTLKNLFPLNPETSSYEFRRKELFKINFAHTSKYKQSTIPFCQRLLNDYYSKEDWKL